MPVQGLGEPCDHTETTPHSRKGPLRRPGKKRAPTGDITRPACCLTWRSSCDPARKKALAAVRVDDCVVPPVRRRLNAIDATRLALNDDDVARRDGMGRRVRRWRFHRVIAADPDEVMRHGVEDYRYAGRGPSLRSAAYDRPGLLSDALDPVRMQEHGTRTRSGDACLHRRRNRPIGAPSTAPAPSMRTGSPAAWDLPSSTPRAVVLGEFVVPSNIEASSFSRGASEAGASPSRPST